MVMMEMITFVLVGLSASFLVIRDDNIVLIPGFFCYTFLRDIYHGGFGHSNGRLLSFLDSFNSCYKFRVAIEDENPRNAPTNFARATTLKFMAGTMTSILLGHNPTILRGPRHILSFTVAFCIVFVSDIVYLKIKQSFLSRLCLGVANALYKLRKLMFVLHHGSSLGLSFTLLVAIIAIEGSSSLRNLTCGKSTSKKIWEQMRIIQVMSSFAEVFIAVIILYLTCANKSLHATEPSFMEPMRSIFYWSYAEILSHEECVMNPDDLSLSPCVTAKWLGFLIFIVRNCKSEFFYLFDFMLSSRESSRRNSSSSSSRAAHSSNNNVVIRRRLFMSPFKK